MISHQNPFILILEWVQRSPFFPSEGIRQILFQTEGLRNPIQRQFRISSCSNPKQLSHGLVLERSPELEQVARNPPLLLLSLNQFLIPFPVRVLQPTLRVNIEKVSKKSRFFISRLPFNPITERTIVRFSFGEK